MRVYQVILVALVAGTALPIALHHRAHGVFNVHQMALAFFLWLNVLVALWEICLCLRIDLIEAQHRRFIAEYRGREMVRVKDFMATKLGLRAVFSPSTWAEVWSTYSVFDPSYADRKSFGFFVDIGNGFTTLVPALLFLYGMTFELLPARVMGIIGLLMLYQMWYGTLIYFVSYLFNRRYRGHSARNVALFVGLSNGLWLVFPLWGMWAAVSLIDQGSYALFRA